MGIKTKLQPVASIGLGSNSVSVLEMASAYATLAAGGVLLGADGDPEGRARRRRRSDKDAGWGVSKRKRVFSDGVAYEVTKILKSNILARHRRRARTTAIRRQAGKTGTTDDFGRRLVRRLHAEGVDGRLGRLPERADRR